jgi:hypothetical protein
MHPAQLSAQAPAVAHTAQDILTRCTQLLLILRLTPLPLLAPQLLLLLLLLLLVVVVLHVPWGHAPVMQTRLRPAAACCQAVCSWALQV